MNIAVVRSPSHVKAGDCREPIPEASPLTTAEVVAEALADDGHAVTVCEADARLMPTLERFMPFTEEGTVTGLVFNLARAGHGDGPAGCVPALLEMAGLPYTGPGPLGHVTAFDTVLWRALLAQAGVTVAPYAVLRWRGEDCRRLQCPLDVSPRYRRAAAATRTVWSRLDLGAAVDAILADGDQEVVVAERLKSVEFSCALLGNGDDLELLPILERHDAAPGNPGHVTGLASTALGLRIGATAATAFKAAHCQDYARVIVRLDRLGGPVVVDVDALPRVDRDSSLTFAAVAGDYGHSALVSRVLDIAHRRGFGVAAPRFDIGARDRSHPPSLLRLLGPTG